VLDYKDHENGPALLFRYLDPEADRFDHYLATNCHKLTTDQRLDILRQIAGAIRYAHSTRIIHRALGPQSILVSDAWGEDGRRPDEGARHASARGSTRNQTGVNAAWLLDRLFITPGSPSRKRAAPCWDGRARLGRCELGLDSCRLAGVRAVSRFVALAARPSPATSPSGRGWPKAR
jgi:hypothetical protein